ncbi:hypothetical protein R3P38DRAFT_2891799 [Favolaschia claudopus]|uniref:Uncharacterized protein n=1 Tax=Favolaschia claudopus TaxID=2862362 RepID=A0AAW0CVR6_9AGAR
MDPAAVNTNITVDDFDSVLTYADPSVWSTPDPSPNNVKSGKFDPSKSPFLQGTYHTTTTPGASISFNFTGPAVYLFGASGPSYGSFEVVLDGGKPVTKSAYAAENASFPYLLFADDGLDYAQHSLTIKNLGKQGEDKSDGPGAFLFDFLRTTVQLGPAGATIKNQTVEETSSSLTFTGTWGHNTSPAFSGGGSTFTNGNNASFSLAFNASAIYVFGDKKNDHGLYRVFLDDATEPTVLTGVSGCGGAFGQTCEQQVPTLKYFASNLGEGEHRLRLENDAGSNESFFDLDSIVLTVPSVYAPRTLGSSSPGANSSNPSSNPNSNSSNPSNPNAPPPSAALGIHPHFGLLNLLVLGVVGVQLVKGWSWGRR